MKKKRFLIWFLVISVLANGWVLYKWQQQASILEEDLYELTLTDDVIFGLQYFTASDLNFSEEATFIRD